MLLCILNSVPHSRSNSITEFTSPFEATAVELLKVGGLNIIGKANCDELEWGKPYLLGFAAFRQHSYPHVPGREQHPLASVASPRPRGESVSFSR
ncbi:uncharacterized protein BJ212DRAFT_1311321 [Suillus subaureus]|uniref:Uncharacterized protein n=1 Tax=Suillus subaureus TaxID=48587 RepID=A0A9P7EQA2_9AGAM|nr:uncharacterized protein BJ212DRAFT_1311321 [Suillus subaureus]KAG1827285.1 hypothetical protein BJ212DRAFT_1311321 [Suillus subaureus]